MNVPPVLKKLHIKRWAILSFFAYVLIEALSLLPPYIMKVILDTVIPAKDIPGLIGSVLAFVLLPFIFIAGRSLFNYFVISFARNKGNEITIHILKNLVYQNMTFFDANNSMELMSYSSQESTGYINFYVSEYPKYYANILISMILLAILFSYSPYLGLLQLLFIPLAIFPTNLISKHLQKHIETVIQENAALSQIRSDILKGIETVKLLRAEEGKVAEVDRVNQRIVKVWGVVAALDSTTAIWISGFLGMLFTGLTFALASILMMYQIPPRLSTGSLVSLVTYMGLLYASLNACFMTRVEGKKQESEYKQLFSYLEMEGEREENEGKPDFSFGKDLVFRSVSFKYEKQETAALKEINLTIPKGSWVGLVGPSGSGKSTILNLILRFYDVAGGQILVDGRDVREVNSLDLRRKISKVSQNVFFFPGTLRDNLLLAKEGATEEELREALDFACLTEYLRALPQGLDTEIGEAGKLMSGGERQRLSLAQAVLRDTPLLLLDEVTANVDLALEEKIAGNLRSLVTKKGTTIVSITHHPRFVEQADAVYRLEEGTLVQER